MDQTWLPGLGLTKREKDVILKGDWLTDEILNAASSLLKVQFPNVSGLNMASFCKLGFSYSPTESIQFHNINNSHWLLSSSLGGSIQIYDSLSSGINISHDLKSQITLLYSPDGASVSTDVINVHQQQGSTDCGLFAIGFAIDLLSGNDVTTITYNQSEFRKHLIANFENGMLTPFPKTRLNPQQQTISQQWEGTWITPKQKRSPSHSGKRFSAPSGENIPIKNFFNTLQEEKDTVGVTSKDTMKVTGKVTLEEMDPTAATLLQSPNKTKWKVGDLFLNLSKVKLTVEQKNILELGLKFCPSPTGINEFNLVKDLVAFDRRLRLQEFFFDQEEKEELPEWWRFKDKKRWTPMKNREAGLETYLDLIINDTLKLSRINEDDLCNNLKPEERNALKSLKQNEEITIKQADKGGAVVVMDSDAYKENIMKMLSNVSFYME